MLDIVIRVNGKITKYVYARNIAKAPDNEPSIYETKPGNAKIEHKGEDGIFKLAVKMIEEHERWEKETEGKIDEKNTQ